MTIAHGARGIEERDDGVPLGVEPALPRSQARWARALSKDRRLFLFGLSFRRIPVEEAAHEPHLFCGDAVPGAWVDLRRHPRAEAL